MNSTGETFCVPLSRSGVRLGTMSSLDISYSVVPSPIGEMLLAATDSGLVRVAFARENFSVVLDELSKRAGPVAQRSTSFLDDATQQIGAYFARARTSFDLSLDFSEVSEFRRQVLSHLVLVPWGHTETYTEVASAVGSPQAVRAVGSACANNPLPLVLPCHRVVRSDGKPGGYLGGPEAKGFLLGLEAA